MWAGGIAAGVALVCWWRVVGRGFLVLGVAVSALIGGAGAAAGAGVWGWTAVALVMVALLRPRWAPGALGAGAISWVVAAAGSLGWGAVPGALALGGVTGEMLLGHWYLVDPRLPRSALRNLAVAGLVGELADSLTYLVTPAVGSFVSPVVLTVLVATSVLLLVGVLFSLRVPSYTGVMAATGLSYLAVLTTLGAVIGSRAG